MARTTTNQWIDEPFHLYRTCNFRKQPRLFGKQAPIEQSFRLDPAQLEATEA